MQFNKIDCINKDLMQKLKDHMTQSYKLGECQIVGKVDTSISQSIKDEETLSNESNEEESTAKSTIQKKTPTRQQVTRRKGTILLTE